jgi:hypothetical protein
MTFWSVDARSVSEAWARRSGFGSVWGTLLDWAKVIEAKTTRNIMQNVKAFKFSSLRTLSRCGKGIILEVVA